MSFGDVGFGVWPLPVPGGPSVRKPGLARGADDCGWEASIVGALLYCACNTRPDIAYPVGMLSRAMARPTPELLEGPDAWWVRIFGPMQVLIFDGETSVNGEEAEDDLMRLVGLGKESDINRSSLQTARNRFIWLTVNLATAVLASMVISLFQGTIQEVVALAVLMPIVASMGGNAGTQTLAVAVRALAMKDLRARKAVQFITREALVGMFNGIGFAAIAFAFSALWFQDLMLGVVIGVAMLVNLIVAGISGTLVPIVLDRLNVDPANASAVFLTTITDVVGFFVFLGFVSLRFLENLSFKLFLNSSGLVTSFFNFS